MLRIYFILNVHVLYIPACFSGRYYTCHVHYTVRSLLLANNALHAPDSVCITYITSDIRALGQALYNRIRTINGRDVSHRRCALLVRSVEV